MKNHTRQGLQGLRFLNVIAYFPKFKEITWPRPCPTGGHFVISRLIYIFKDTQLPSALWRCWLGGRKGIWSVTWVMGFWHCYLSGVRSTISCSS